MVSGGKAARESELARVTNVREWPRGAETWSPASGGRSHQLPHPDRHGWGGLSLLLKKQNLLRVPSLLNSLISHHPRPSSLSFALMRTELACPWSQLCFDAKLNILTTHFLPCTMSTLCQGHALAVLLSRVFHLLFLPAHTGIHIPLLTAWQRRS